MKFPVVPGFDQQAFRIYLKNTGWLFLARVGSLGIKILAGIAVANYLGKTANGILNYPLVFVTFFIAAAALGLDGFVIRELISEPEKKNKLLGTAFRMRLVAGIAIIPLAWLAYTLFKGSNDDIPVGYILIASCIGITQSLSIIDSYFQSRVQGKYVMMVQVMGNLLSAAIKLILIFISAPLIWFIWTLLIDAAILGIGYLIAYRAKGNNTQEWKYEGSLARYLLKNSWPLAFSAILVTVYMKIGQLMVESFLGVAALGIYSTVVNWSESWYFIPVAIVTSVFPAIMSFASNFIYQYFYTAEFAEGAKILTIHIWAGVFVFLGSASGQYLIAEGYTRYSLYRTGAGAVVNVVLGFFWIPIYGLQGAAFATLIAYFSATFFILFFPETRKQGINMLKSLFLISLFQKIAKR
jgi:O-antigen/teichoic acid export membrane protein